MTDKVQKIKEWISNEQDGLMDAQGNFEYPEHEGAYHILCNLNAYIDSLQEEPCNSCQGFNDKDKCDELVFTHNCPIVKNPVSIWHDASEKPREGSWVCVNRNGGLTISTFLYDDGKLHNDYIDNELENCKWAYPRDLINVDNICNFGKNLQEEPVSNDFEEALAQEWKSYNDRGAATVDALEDNTQELAFAKGFYRGAKWGKNQAKVEIQVQSMAFAHGCPKEHVSEDLEEASKTNMAKYVFDKNVSDTPVQELKYLAYNNFIDGANWQKEHIIGNVRSILNKVAYENNGLDVNGDYCEQPYVELDDEFRKLLKEV